MITVYLLYDILLFTKDNEKEGYDYEKKLTNTQ